MGLEFLGEFVGTFILVLLGNGISCNALFKYKHGYKSNWLTIIIGWFFAVFFGVTFAQIIGGKGFTNPAVSIATLIKTFNTGVEWKYLGYIGFQFLGAFVAQWFIYFLFFPYIKNEESKTVLDGSSTNSYYNKNYLTCGASEFICTVLLLVIGFYVLNNETFQIKQYIFLKSLVVSAIVFSVCLSLGGVTGAAINPARDFGPRLAHFILYKTILRKHKYSGSNFTYGLVPMVAPALAGVVVGVSTLFFKTSW